MFRIQAGVRKPETARETEEQSTIEGMRRAIYQASRESVLIRQILRIAEVRGLSGDDTMTMLAYHALRSLEDQWEVNLRTAELSPIPPLVFLKDKL
jgi:hypothetical protein